jgi:hypothetical protein
LMPITKAKLQIIIVYLYAMFHLEYKYRIFHGA